MLKTGASTLGGEAVVNPSGGLLSKGHAIGISGVAEVAEMYWQLAGNARARQVEGARIVLSRVTGGGISDLDFWMCAIHVFDAYAR